ncbi:uncharacterized protein B0H18DRAFT_1128270 [Fomitopsis serialis]|uniref:uncharacterized protein n=1 Tax=Fomitopsis serialis TaxID=139415 RepID=UPI002008D567|nr:uncharacterized protein B0H18DRAFT_1128270 [Neoantrodia serialis]KAH9911665.1 hypothetical protein B0H18DRAFT_1128270 [Neoantrodia serialis]
MANLIRSPKAGSDWTGNDLAAYNIQMRLESAASFFGDHTMPPPNVDQEILTTQNAQDMYFDRNAELINLLDLAMSSMSAEDSAVDDFAVELLKHLGYVKRHRIARTRKDIPFYVCGEWTHAETDVCLLDRQQNDILLLVQEDERSQPEHPRDPGPQLVAKAIAAFDYNNSLRQATGQATVDSKVMAGIALLGTMPTFYKIPVTAGLVRDVHYGAYPSKPTTVSVHVPELPSPAGRYSEGMKPLDNRQAVLRCYEAFKGSVGI